MSLSYNKQEHESFDGISVVIPVYNEEGQIGPILEHACQVLSKMPLVPGFEIIVVDDGSTDNSPEIVGRFENVRLIRVPHNMGYGAAIKAGVRSAKFRWILTMDADGQHRLDRINSFLSAQKEGYDLIIGSRARKNHTTLMRRPGKAVMGMLANWLSGTKIPDVNSGMRLFKRTDFLEFLPLYPNGFSLSTTMTLAFLADGYSVKFVPFETYERVGRRSNVRILRDGLNTVIMIIRAVSLFNPLRVFIPLSIFCGVIGIGMTALNIILYGRVPNTGVLMLLGCLLIFLFGILADQFSLLRRQHGMKNNHIISRED